MLAFALTGFVNASHVNLGWQNSEMTVEQFSINEVSPLAVKAKTFLKG